MSQLFEVDGKSPLLFLPEHILISFLNKASFEDADLEKIKEEVLDNEPLFLPEPRRFHEVFEAVLRKGKFPFTLKGYFKFGFQARFEWLASQTRHRRNGAQSVIVRFLDEYWSLKDVGDALNMLSLFIQQASSVSGPSASDMYSQTPIDHLVEWIKWTADTYCGDGFQAGICELIDMLCEYGGAIDLYQGRFADRGHEDEGPANAVELAMQSYCNFSLLDTFLSWRPQSEGPLTARSKLWRRFGPELPRGKHRAMSQMEWIVAGIHTQFYGRPFGPFKGCYAERLKGHDYPGDMAYVYKTKVRMLSNDYCTDETEKEALNNLATAVEEVQKMLHFTGRLHFSKELEHEGLFKLFSAVSCLASDSYRKECEELTEKFGPRRHQFIINDRFDPRVEWMKYTADARIPELQSEFGEIFRDEALEIWRRLIIERGDNRPWWEISEQDKWFVPVEDVKACLRAANPFAAAAMGL
ncbi:hypothetical protein IL306_005814 [Fusarium sp. DS 682]|nr:hypothetical protein IL306_005814 [Fusarium sp. DS 682]